MKKMFKYAVMAMLGVAGSLGAQARYWEYDPEAPILADHIQAGKNYVLQSGLTAAAGAHAFLNGTNFSTLTNPPATAVYQFEEAGEATEDGTTIFYLKSASGEYLASPSNGSFYTKALDRAWKITVKTPTVYESTYSYVQESTTLTGVAAYKAAVRAGDNEVDWNTFTFQNVDNSVVIVSATPGAAVEDIAEYNSFVTHRASYQDIDPAAKGVDYNRNCWVIYEATPMDPIASLDAVMKQITTGTLQEKIANYKVGDSSGQYAKDKYDLLTSLWAKGEAWVAANQGDSPEAIDQLAEDILKAYNDFINSGKPLVAGHYIITSWRADNAAGLDGGALYDGAALNPSQMKLCWTYNGKGGATYTAGQDLDYATAKFVWEVTPDPENPGLFFFRNLETGNYIGTTPTIETVIPMTTTAQASYNIVANPDVPGYFSFYNPKLFHTSAADYGGLHTSGWRGEVVPWDWRTGGSSWHVREVSDEELATLRSLMEQPKRNAALTRIYNAATDAIAKGKAYMAVDAEGNKIAAAASGEVGEADGLVTTPEQLVSPMAESSEGQQPGFLLDNKLDSYFHTTWSSAWGGPHYLQMTLSTAEKDVFLKWVKRNGNNNNGAPYDIVMWGTNNEADLQIDKVTTPNEDGTETVTVDGWKKNWKKLGSGQFKYQYNVTWLDGSTKANAAGTAHVSFDEPYKYLRMEIITRLADSDQPAGNKYINGAEFRVYKAVYDKVGSLIEAVPAEVQKALTDAMAAAKPHIDAGTATDDMIAQLQAAYDNFMKSYPDPTRITSAIAESRAILAAAQEGSDLGYYTDGSKATAETVLKSVEDQLAAIVAKGQPTVAEVDRLLAELTAGMDAFAKALRVPQDGIYFIKSNSSNVTMAERSIFAGSSSRESYLMMSGRVKNGETWADDNLIQNRLGAYWQVTKVEGGYTYKNLYTGLYMAPYTQDKSWRMVTQSEKPYVFDIQFAKEPGCFNIVAKEEDVLKDGNGSYLYLNSQPSNAALVFWFAATGRDNSAFRFEVADPKDILEGGHIHSLQKAGAPQIITLPVAVTVGADEGFYTVIGQDAQNNIQLKAKEGELEAGQAYVFKPAADNTESILNLILKAKTLNDLVQTHTEAAPFNGLVPTFENVKVAPQSGIFSTDHSKVLLSEENEKVIANSGYFSKLPATDQQGDAFIPANGLITGINNLVVISKSADNGIYTLSGVRVKNTKSLPAGLYIVNGQKVVVK